MKEKWDYTLMVEVLKSGEWSVAHIVMDENNIFGTSTLCGKDVTDKHRWNDEASVNAGWENKVCSMCGKKYDALQVIQESNDE